MKGNELNCEETAQDRDDVRYFVGSEATGLQIQGEDHGALLLLTAEMLGDPKRFRLSFNEFLDNAEEDARKELSGPQLAAMVSLIQHIRRWRYNDVLEGGGVAGE